MLHFVCNFYTQLSLFLMPPHYKKKSAFFLIFFERSGMQVQVQVEDYFKATRQQVKQNCRKNENIEKWNGVEWKHFSYFSLFPPFDHSSSSSLIFIIPFFLFLQVFKLDDITSSQRAAVYSQRRAFLSSSDEGKKRCTNLTSSIFINYFPLFFVSRTTSFTFFFLLILIISSSISSSLPLYLFLLPFSLLSYFPFLFFESHSSQLLDCIRNAGHFQEILPYYNGRNICCISTPRPQRYLITHFLSIFIIMISHNQIQSCNIQQCYERTNRYLSTNCVFLCPIPLLVLLPFCNISPPSSPLFHHLSLSLIFFPSSRLLFSLLSFSSSHLPRLVTSFCQANLQWVVH